MRLRIKRAGAVVAVFALFALLPNALAQAVQPGSSMTMLDGMLGADGAVVLQNKGCTSCHSFDGYGGMLGPDLGFNRIRGTSPSSLTAAMWNQAPSMWRSIGPGEVPTLTPKEAAALFAFFYSRLYFDSYPDSPNGEDRFKARCGGCHDLKVSTTSKKVGPPASTWGSIKDPIVLVGRMWNHSTDMLDQTLRQGRSWPRLSGQDTRDIVSYLWRLPELQPVKSAFRFGDDVRGRTVFSSQCAQCHTLGAREAGRVNLADRLRRVTMLQLAASMWNHAPTMKQKNPGVKLPVLDENDARDLVTFLVVGRAFEESGDVRRGENLFWGKRCASCHQEGKGTAPAVASLKGPFNPVRMTAALWSHGPKMLEEMKRQKIAWPRLQPAEMLDLLAYLNDKAGK